MKNDFIYPKDSSAAGKTIFESIKRMVEAGTSSQSVATPQLIATSMENTRGTTSSSMVRDGVASWDILAEFSETGSTTSNVIK